MSYNKETLTWYMFVDDTVSPDKVYDKLFRHAASTFAKRGIINTTIDITIQRQDGVKWASEKDKQISSWLAKGNVQHLGINEALTYTDGDYIQYILTAQFYEKD
jgi:hypothetical protein